MLTLTSQRRTYPSVRFATSPLWETVAFARLVARGDDQRGAPGLTPADIPLLSGVLARDRPYTPDFIAPPPMHGDTTFDEELARMRATPPHVVEAEVARMGGACRDDAPLGPRGRHRPSRLLAAVADEVALVWGRAVRHRWRRVLAILDGDIMIRGRRLALDGPHGLFPDLPGVVFHDRHLSFRSAQGHRRLALDRELLLVPSVFGSPSLFAVVDAPWTPSVYYPARGASEIWQRGTRAPDRLETLAGRARARVLKAATLPSTTTEIAARLRMAPASASQHLQRLLAAGLVRRTRAGRSVIYLVTDVGAELVALLDTRP